MIKVEGLNEGGATDHSWVLCFGFWALKDAERGTIPKKVKGLEAMGLRVWLKSWGVCPAEDLERG